MRQYILLLIAMFIPLSQLFAQVKDSIDQKVYKNISMDEVTVVSKKKQVIYKLDKKLIDATNNLLATGGSAVNILENMPSIRIGAEGDVSFRGSSGFIVYVDGKPSPLSGTQALQQIPAAQIQHIEIITTPSARYDTGGDVGIINVVTKKDFASGLNGIFNISGGTDLSNSIDFLLTENRAKSSWFIGGAMRNTERKSDFEQNKTTIINDITTTSKASGPRRSLNSSYSLKGGWEKRWLATRLGFDLEAGYASTKLWGDLNYDETRSTGGATPSEHSYMSVDRFKIYENYGSGNISFNHNFKKNGHKLTANFYLKYGGGAVEYFESNLFNKQGEREQGHKAWESEHRWTVRSNIDYVLPYSETGRLEAGYQYFSYSEDGDYKMQFYDPANKNYYWRDDIYNTFYFQRGINAIYAIINQDISKFNVQVGVRGEHTHQVLGSSRPGTGHVKNRFELFPSAHVGYTFLESNRIQAAYSRRTTRPELYFMEPYITYRDYYTAEIGNPDIRPEYINSFELSYRKSIGSKTFTLTGFHRSRTDKIERLRVPYSVPGVTLDSMANVGNDYSSGAELNGVIPINHWWDLTLNASLYHYAIKNNFSKGVGRLNSTNYDVSISNAFEIKRKTRIQFDANFIGPSVTTQGGTDSYFFANFAASHPIINNRLLATASFRNIFNTAKYVSTINQADLSSSTIIRPKFPLIMLTLSYNFNGYKSSNKIDKQRTDFFEGTNH